MDNIQTPQNLGEQNKKAIIEILKTRGPLSRAALSRITGLSFPATSSNINYLIDKNYIIEAGEGNNSMGRKSTLVRFNEKKGYVLGIDLGRRVVMVMVSDLLGNTITEMSVSTDSLKEGKNFVNGLKTLIQQVIEKANIDIRKLLSVGIGVPGIINKETGKLHIAPYTSGLGDVNFNDDIAILFDCPVTIENSVNHGAIGEKWKGLGNKYRNQIYVNYGIGIGSALILDGKLYTGNNGIAGEIGYMVTSTACIRKEYNEIGVLEQQISGSSIDKAITDFGVGSNSLEELMSSRNEIAQQKRIEIINDIKEKFGVVLLNIATTINPEVIILSGGIGINIGDILVPEWNSMLRNNLPFPPKVILSNLGNRANLYGAVRAALYNIKDIYCAVEENG